MTESTRTRLDDIARQLPAVAASHERSNREALLEHARMGRSVPEWDGSKVVWITPEEIFARYGLDANGKPTE